MRKLTVISLGVIVVLLATGSSLANSITLLNSAQVVTFAGLGAGNTTQLSVSFGSCGGGGCILSGSASGLVTIGGTTFVVTGYSISTSGPVTATLQPNGTFLGVAVFNASFTTTSGMMLSGTMTCDVETGRSLSVGISWKTSLPLNPSVIPTGGNINDLLGTNNSLSGSVSPIPEPSSMLLFGSGLVALTGLMWRRPSHKTLLRTE
jgi:hypothetical protein